MPEIKELKDTLYVKLPTSVKDTLSIKLLHPDIEDVRIPRQKRRRFCLIKFTDLEKCTKVKNDLCNKTIDGKRIFVEYAKQKIFKSEKDCVKLIVTNLPDDIHKKQVKKAVPKAIKVKIIRANKKRKFTWAMLMFESKADAEKIASAGTLNIKDVNVKVRYYKNTEQNQEINKKFERNKSKKIKESDFKQENVTPRYFEVVSREELNIDFDESNDSTNSIMTDISDNSDLESFDLEYNGCFDSDSD